MNYQWADGFHAPKGVAAEAVKAALDKLPEPSPDRLLDASKRKSHVLHGEIWSEGDKVWANRARLDRCRQIIGGIHETVIVGGKEMTVRAVEFVKSNGDARWANLDDIRADPSLLDAYEMQVAALLEQAQAKFAKLRELRKG